MSAKTCLIIFAILCILATIGTLIGVSFSKLDANDMGLNYSANSLTIDTTKVYTSGVHFLGLGHSFIVFPRTIQELEFTGSEIVVARSQDGLPVSIEGRVLYRLRDNVDSLATLHLMFRSKHKDAYLISGKQVIRDVASTYDAFDFWSSRDLIQTAMTEQLAIRMGDLFATDVTFVLTSAEVPYSLQMAITQTVNTLNLIQQVQSEKSIAVTETGTLIQQAEREAMIIGSEANATATTILFKVNAEIVRINTTVDAELAAYDMLRSTLGWSTEELVSYVWLDTMNNAPTSQKLYSIPKPSLFNF